MTQNQSNAKNSEADEAERTVSKLTYLEQKIKEIEARKDGRHHYFESQFGLSEFEDFKQHYMHSITFNVSTDEAGWTASAIDFENPENAKDTGEFISQQKKAGLSVGIANTLHGDPTEGLKYFLETANTNGMLLGYGNFARNDAWKRSHEGLRQALITVKSAPHDLKALFYQKAYETTILATPSWFLPDTTKKISNHFLKRTGQTDKVAREVRAQVTEDVKDSAYIESWHARLNAGFAGLGAALHAPLGVEGVQGFITTYAATGDAIGAIGSYVGGLGAAAATGGFALMSLDQGIEAKKWMDHLGEFGEEAISHEESHKIVGYFSRKDASGSSYVADFMFKWVPSMTFVLKGGAFGYEAYHYGVEPFLNGSVSIGDMFNSLTPAKTVAEGAAWGVGGYYFTKSGIHEFNEQNENKIKYMWNKGVKAPYQRKAYEMEIRTAEFLDNLDEKISNSNNKTIQRIWKATALRNIDPSYFSSKDTSEAKEAEVTTTEGPSISDDQDNPTTITVEQEDTKVEFDNLIVDEDDLSKISISASMDLDEPS